MAILGELNGAPAHAIAAESETTRLSADGMFPNGVTAVAVARFVFEHDETVRIEDVAEHFRLGIRDVADGLMYYASHAHRLSAEAHRGDAQPGDPPR